MKAGLTQADRRIVSDKRLEKLDEHDCVALLEDASDNGVLLSAGSVGTIVSVHVPDEVFLVEFTHPRALLTLERRQVRLFERLGL